MKIENLFNKTITSASLDDLAAQAESHDYIAAWRKDKDRFVPAVDFSKVENFARFGSAEQYYDDAIKRIYATYPYDGSLFERQRWHLSSSYFDNYIFENEWQSFRSTKNDKLEFQTPPRPLVNGKIIGVKVIDIFGNDTMKIFKI